MAQIIDVFGTEVEFSDGATQAQIDDYLNSPRFVNELSKTNPAAYKAMQSEQQQVFRKEQEAEPSRHWHDYITDTAVDAVKAFTGTGEAAVGLADLLTGNLVGDSLAAIGYDPKATNKILEESYSAARQHANREVSQAEGFGNTIKQVVQHPSTAVGAIVQSLPLTLSGTATVGVVAERMLAKELATLGIKKGTEEAAEAAAKYFARPEVIKALTYTAAASEGAVTAGSIQEQGRQEGRTWGETAPYAVAGGAVTGLIGGLSSKVMPDVDVKLALAGLPGAEKQTLLQTGKAIAKDMFKEGVLEEMPQSAQEQVFTNLAMGKPWNEGVGNAAAMGLITGGLQGGGMSGVAQYKNAAAADTDPLTEGMELRGAEEAARMAGAADKTMSFVGNQIITPQRREELLAKMRGEDPAPDVEIPHLGLAEDNVTVDDAISGANELIKTTAKQADADEVDQAALLAELEQRGVGEAAITSDMQVQALATTAKLTPHEQEHIRSVVAELGDAATVKMAYEFTHPDVRNYALLLSQQLHQDVPDATPEVSQAKIQAHVQKVEQEAINRPATMQLHPQTGEELAITATPERIAHRQKVADEIYGTGAAQKNRRADIVIGLPGSGKSSAIVNQLKRDFGSFELDADAVKEKLDGFDNGRGANAVHEESSHIAEGMLLARAMQSGDNIAWPMVGKNSGKLKGLVSRLKKYGYDVHLHHVEVKPETSKQRALSRYFTTGRLVPSHVIESYGLRPQETYATLKADQEVKSYANYSNEVPYGSPAKLLESSANYADELARGAGRAQDGQGAGNAGSPVGGTGQDDAVAVEKLKTSLGASTSNVAKSGGTARPISNITAAAPNEQQKAVADVIQAATGRRVIFVNGAPFNGVQDPTQNDVVFVATDTENPLLTTSGHEAFHGLTAAEKRRLITALMPFMKGTALEKYHTKMRMMHGNDFSLDKTLEEMTADALGQRMTEVGFWQSMWADDKPLFQKLSRLVLKALDAMGTRGAKSKFLQEHFDKIDEVRAIIDSFGKEVLKPAAMLDNTAATPGLIIDKKRGMATFSARTFQEADSKGYFETAAKEIVAKGIATEKQAKKFLKDSRHVLRFILDHKDQLDYQASDAFKAIKVNSAPQYAWSEDFTTICRKTAALIATVSKIMVKNGKGMTAKQYVAVRAELEKLNFEVNCAVCYVSSRWITTQGKILDQMAHKDVFMKGAVKSKKLMKEADAAGQDVADYASAYWDRTFSKIPKELIYDMSRTGELKAKFPLAWSWKQGRGAGAGKSIEARAEYYQGLLKEFFPTDKAVRVQNLFSGMRLQSWSNFDVLHVLDLMQATFDRASLGLAAHAYTKVTDFVRLMGKTGTMINMSLIPKGEGVDANGTLLFDSTEGMDFDAAVDLRKKFGKTAGTIAIGVTDAHIRALLKNPLIDYVIPYHASGLSKKLLISMLPGASKWLDYSNTQNDKVIDQDKFDARVERLQEEHGMNKAQAKLVMAAEYWDPTLTGDENGKRFVKYCEENGLAPRFEQFKDDPGYWKLLIDRKMYDNEGVYIAQAPVVPDFDTKVADDIFNRYIGGEINKTDVEAPAEVVAKFSPRSDFYKRLQEGQKPVRGAVSGKVQVGSGVPVTKLEAEQLRAAGLGNFLARTPAGIDIAPDELKHPYILEAEMKDLDGKTYTIDEDSNYTFFPKYPDAAKKLVQRILNDRAGREAFAPSFSPRQNFDEAMAMREQAAKRGDNQQAGYWARIADQNIPRKELVPMSQRTTGNGLRFSISVDAARKLEYGTQWPKDMAYIEAVLNTPGATVVADGVELDLVRFQKVTQAGEQSVRTGVFYLPAGSKNVRYYRTSPHAAPAAAYGGSMKIEGRTLLKAPLVVTAATGGNAPAKAYDQLKGKGAYNKLRSEFLRVIPYNATLVRKADIVAAFLDTHGANSDNAYELVQNSTRGNTLAYAVTENIVAHAARDAGYDSVVGISKSKGVPVISEVFDVREDYYPIPDEEGSIHQFFRGNELVFSPRQQSTAPEETRGQFVRRRFTDRFNRLEVLENWARQNGVNISEQGMGYRSLITQNGRIAAQLQDFTDKTLSPLIKEAGQKKIALADIEKTMLAMHAKEANKVAQRNWNDPTATAFGMTDKEAEAIVKAASADTIDLAKRFQALTAAAADHRLQNGILDQDTLDAWRNAYQFYVPVKGDDGDKTGAAKGQKINRSLKGRKGHEARDEHVIENIVKAYEQAVREVEKNNTSIRIAKFLLELNDPTIGTVGKPRKRPSFTTKSVFEVFKAGNSVAVFEDMAGANSYIRQAGGNPQDYSVAQSTDPAVQWRVSPMLEDNEINFYVAGQQVRIQINDELLAQALTARGEEHLATVFEIGKEINNWFSRAYTGYDPRFTVRNTLRDFTSGMVNLTGDYGATTAAKVAFNYPRAVVQFIKGGQWLEDYKAAGGSTGAAYLGSLERIGNDLMSGYNDQLSAVQVYNSTVAEQLQNGASPLAAKAKALAKSGVAKFFKAPVLKQALAAIQAMNAVSENAFRLSTFITLREQGKTMSEAGAAAKNVTVNFDKRGELGTQLGALYLFFNPAVQGMDRTVRSLFESKHKAQAWSLVGSMAMVGLMAAEMARSLGGDDEDEWDLIPRAVKNRNLVWLLPGGTQVTIPLPYEYGSFVGIGYFMSDAARGKVGKKEIMNLAATIADGIMPFGNPVTEEGINGKSVAQMLPTLAKLLIAPGMNQNSFGMPIQPTKYDENKPDSQNMFRATRGTPYDTVATALNSIGGSKYEAGPLDISPEVLKFYTRSILGGALTFTDQVWQFGKIVGSGAEDTLEAAEVPMVNVLVRTNTVKEARAEFQEVKKEATAARSAIGAAKKAGDREAMIELKDKYGPLVQVARIAEQQQKVASAKRDLIDKIRLDEDISFADKRREIRSIEDDEEAIYKRALDKINEIR